MPPVRSRKVFDGNGSNVLYGVHGQLKLAAGERRRHGLSVQCRLLGPGWRRVHGVRCRHVQSSEWISSVPLVRARKVFDGHGSDSREHVYGVHAQHKLAAGERHRHGLSVQCRLLGPEWRHVHGVRSGQIQSS